MEHKRGPTAVNLRPLLHLSLNQTGLSLRGALSLEHVIPFIGDAHRPVDCPL